MSDARLAPGEAWARLEAGNRHWADDRPRHPGQDAARRRAVAARQDPIATVLSCIDSRVPPETVFDQGVGDLFAVRTGAQVMDDLVAASVQYGPLANGTPLIVVMGHQRCGAVTEAVHAIRGGERLPGQLDAIVDCLRPAFREATGAAEGEEARVPADGDAGLATLIAEVTRTQVKRTVSALASDGPLAARVRDGALGIVGAWYDLDSGVVTRLQAVGV